MRTTFTLSLCLVASIQLHAQVFDWVGHMGYNGNQDGRAVVVDPLGDVYHCGYFIAGIDLDPTPGMDTVLAIGGQDGYLIKQANDGSYLWGAHFAGNCLPNALALTPEGDILVVGTFTGTVDFDPGPGVANMTAPASLWYFVCKLAPDGSYQWARKFGCGQPVYDPAVAVDPSGNIHLTGTFTQTLDADPGDGPSEVFDLTTAGGNDVFISTLDPQGIFVRAMSFGDTGDDRGRDIACDPDGNVYVTGYFAGVVTIDPGGAAITLTCQSGITYGDVFVLKMDPTGGVVLALSFGGGYYDRGQAIAVNANEEMFLGGYATNGADLDPGPGQYLVTSNATPYYVKLDANGAFVHAATAYYQNLSDNEAKNIALDASGNVYLSGTFSGYGVDFDPGPDDTNYSTIGTDGFIAKYDPSGTYLWSAQFGPPGNGQEYVLGMTVDAAGSTYLTGRFTSQVDFDPGPGQTLFSPIVPGYSDAFILKLDPIDLGVTESHAPSQLRAFPVPTSGPLTIALDEPVQKASIRVIDVAGRVVLSQGGLSGERLVLDLSDLPAGTFLLELMDGATPRRTTIIKE